MATVKGGKETADDASIASQRKYVASRCVRCPCCAYTRTVSARRDAQVRDFACSDLSPGSALSNEEDHVLPMSSESE